MSLAAAMISKALYIVSFQYLLSSQNIRNHTASKTQKHRASLVNETPYTPIGQLHFYAAALIFWPVYLLSYCRTRFNRPLPFAL
jgi:hypothetical protein